MLRHLIATLAAVFVPLALAFGGIAILADKASAETSHVDSVFPRGLPYAPTEDSCYTKRCVWDARHQGNGKGHSLILTRHKGEFLATRISHRRAHRLHEAWCDREHVTCDGYWN